MSEFISTNDVLISATPDGYLAATPNGGTDGASTLAVLPLLTEALREFFRAEEDERLGRWRWPENPDYVVYREGDLICVTNERSGHGNVLGRRWYEEHKIGLLAKEEPGVYAAAGAYFEAHPEPKPWHAARAGEVWDVDLDSGGMRAVTITSANYAEPTTVFRDAHTQVEVELDDAYIRDARRVWPEDAS